MPPPPPTSAFHRHEAWVLREPLVAVHSIPDGASSGLERARCVLAALQEQGDVLVGQCKARVLDPSLKAPTGFKLC